MEHNTSLPQKLCEWWFYIITILAAFNCLKRPDWNFAFGLLSYYMLKSIEKSNFEESASVKFMLIIINIGLLVFDIVWVFTLGSIWHGKPTHDKIIWEGFSGLHTFIISLSVFIIIIRWFNCEIFLILKRLIKIRNFYCTLYIDVLYSSIENYNISVFNFFQF